MIPPAKSGKLKVRKPTSKRGIANRAETWRAEREIEAQRKAERERNARNADADAQLLINRAETWRAEREIEAQRKADEQEALRQQANRDQLNEQLERTNDYREQVRKIEAQQQADNTSANTTAISARQYQRRVDEQETIRQQAERDQLNEQLERTNNYREQVRKIEAQQQTLIGNFGTDWQRNLLWIFEEVYRPDAISYVSDQEYEYWRERLYHPNPEVGEMAGVELANILYAQIQQELEENPNQEVFGLYTRTEYEFWLADLGGVDRPTRWERIKQNVRNSADVVRMIPSVVLALWSRNQNTEGTHHMGTAGPMPPNLWFLGGSAARGASAASGGVTATGGLSAGAVAVSIIGGVVFAGSIILGVDYLINGPVNTVSEATPMATLAGVSLDGEHLASTPVQTDFGGGEVAPGLLVFPGQASHIPTLAGPPLDGSIELPILYWQHQNTRKQNQAERRGWTNDDINNAINNPSDTIESPRGNLSTGNSATIYYRSDGHYVIVDDITGDIVQVSDTNDPNWLDEGTNNTKPISPK